MTDRIDPATVAIVGDDPAAQALASDLAARGVETARGTSLAEAKRDCRYSVCFDASATGGTARLRDGDAFFAGSAARPDLAGADALAGEDAANLGWKLALVLRGAAPAALLDSYAIERGGAMPDAPVDYAASPLTSRFGIDKKFRSGPPPGSAMRARPVRIAGHDEPIPLADLCGGGFAALFFTGAYDALPMPLAAGLHGFESDAVPLMVILVSAAEAVMDTDFPLIADGDRALHRSYGAMTGAFYLVRPDHVIAARWQHPSLDAISAALKRATGHTDASAKPARSSGW